MPRIANDYSKTTIYAIVCNNPEITDCYVGSTCCLYSRNANHKSDYDNPEKNHKRVYQFINQNGGYESFSIKTLEEGSFKTQRETEEREQHWCNILNASLNTRSPIRDIEKKKKRQKKYYEDNKTQIKLQQKEYYLKNREKILGNYHLKKLLNLATNNHTESNNNNEDN